MWNLNFIIIVFTKTIEICHLGKKRGVAVLVAFSKNIQCIILYNWNEANYLKIKNNNIILLILSIIFKVISIYLLMRQINFIPANVRKLNQFRFIFSYNMGF